MAARGILLGGFVAITSLLLLPSVAWTAGLGRLLTLSSLEQPLRAEIEIVSLRAGEGDTLSVKLASPEAYKRFHIDFGGTLLSIRLAVERRSDDRYVVTLATAQAINEPFIDILIELDGSGG